MEERDAPDEAATLAPSEPDAAGPARESVTARAGRILAGDLRPGDYLKPPPEVVAEVEQLTADGNSDAEERQWLTDCFNLQAHYTRREVACWRTGSGVIVFAVGEGDVRAFLAWFHRVPEEQRPNVVIEYPGARP